MLKPLYLIALLATVYCQESSDLISIKTLKKVFGTTLRSGNTYPDRNSSGNPNGNSSGNPDTPSSKDKSIRLENYSVDPNILREIFRPPLESDDATYPGGNSSGILFTPSPLDNRNQDGLSTLSVRGIRTNIEMTEYTCELPPYPANGHYTVSNIRGTLPGQKLYSVSLNVTCDPGYELTGPGKRLCIGGFWEPTTVTDSDCVLSSGTCQLPLYPKNGYYTVNNVEGAVPGQKFRSVNLNITCNPGYGLIGSAVRLCVDGVWLPTAVSDAACVRFCRVNIHPSVHFRCLSIGTNALYTTVPFRECNEYEPDGAVVAPECNKPNYYYLGVLPYMHCVGGKWSYEARCLAECGRVVPKATDLIINDGRIAILGELPWHAGIYRKTTTPYEQICGGSLVSSKVVISAAHCFWDDALKAQPAANYAVTLGKLYRPYNYQEDQNVQRSDVADIKLTPYFHGRTTNFQDDIAVLLLASTIELQPHIRPVCVDFNVDFENLQLSPGNTGKVAGWGLTEANGKSSSVLKVVEMPYVSIQECHAAAPLDFREYITADKFCAGYRNGTAVCKGDSGGGLAFPDLDARITRYYLRGIVSTAPKTENLCNAYWMTTYTKISRHEHFIKTYL